MKAIIILLKAQIDKLFINTKNEDTIGEYKDLVVNSIINSELSVSEQSSVLKEAIKELALIRASEIVSTNNQLSILEKDYESLKPYLI